MTERALLAYLAGTRPAASPRTSTIICHVGVFVIAIGVFLAPYAEWRIADVFITASDGLFALGGCLLLAGGGLKMRPFGTATPYWLLSVIMMLVGLFIGSVVNGDPVRWLIAAAQYGFGLVFLPFILADGDDDARTTLFVKALLAGVVLMELFGAIVYYGYPATYEEYQEIATNFITGGRRLGAFVGQANWNAAMIAMVLPFVLYTGAKKQLPLAVAYFCCAVLAVGLLLSASFTGFISALVVLIVFLMVGGTRKVFRVMAVLAAAGAILVAAGYQLPEVFQGRVGGAIESGDMSQAGTYTGRMDLIHEAWEIVEDTMIVGLGVDQYRTISFADTPVHNMYLLLWAEGGLLALLGWLLLMTISALVAIGVYRYDRQAAALGLSVLATFLIFSTASPHMYARVWLVPLMLALTVVSGKMSGMNNAYLSGYLQRQ